MRHAAPGILAFAVSVAVAPLRAQAPAFVLDEMHRLLPPAHNAVRGTVVGDVDGDGLPDLVVQNGHQSNLVTSVWRQAGNGRFVSVQDAVLEPFASVALLLGDFDGDGDRDLVTARAPFCGSYPTCNGGQASVLWNDGSGHFTAPGYALPLLQTRITTSMAAGDVDGDGDLDLVLGCVPHVWSIDNFPLPPIWFSEHGENWLFTNNGSGVFTAAAIGADLDATRAVLLADFDGDGDLDLFAANAGQDRYYRNSGNGTFVGIAGALPAAVDYALSAQTLDLEGDGDLDVLLLTWQGARLLRNDGTGTFTDVTGNLPIVLTTVDQVFAADFDGDGDIDIGQRGGTAVIQLRNDGTGAFSHAPAADRTLLVPRALVPIDLDGDGDIDLAQANGATYEHVLFLNDGTGAMNLVPHEVPDALDNQLVPALVDLDLDGDLDVLAPAETSPNRVYRNDGGGQFTSVAFGDFTVDLGSSLDLAVGDLDGDGLVDAVLANSLPYLTTGSLSHVYRNDGAGRLDRVAAPTIDAYCTALGDVDGDGDLDIYLGRAAFLGSNGIDQVWRNQGNMTFVPIAGAVTGAASSMSVVLVDVDGDGDLDAALAAWNNGGNRVLLNDGTGIFTPAPVPLPNATGNSQHIVALDVDGDGDMDLLVANDGSPNKLYRNNGAGVFTDSSQDLPQDNGRTISFAVGDFDGDGDLDLLECMFHSPVPTRALQNDGLGHFTVVPGGLPVVTDYAHRFAPGDLDGDGDLDAFLVTQGPPRVYYNQRRQFAWRELPRIARTVTMDLYGAPSDLYVFVASPVRVHVPLPGLGTLQVDIGTPLTVEFGQLDAQGHDSRSYLVPSYPALIGVPFYWQALSGNPGVLGNLEITTLHAN